MSGMKKKLMATVFMLVVSVLMLTTASYAWFTISTNPEITAMTTQVVVNENLEVALAKTTITAIPIPAALNDSGNQYTWGNVIDLSDTDLTGEAGDPYYDLVKTLRPATLDSTAKAFKYPTYGADGRINVASTALVALTDSAMANGFGNLLGEGSPAKVYGYYIDLWVRSNVGGDLKLSDVAVKRSSDATVLATSGSYFLSDGTNAAAKDLASNIRIAFKDVTPEVTGATKADGTAAPVAVTAGTATKITGDKYKTLFSNGASDKIVTLTANDAKLIRMYVYLEGANVTNASASIDGAPTSGILNVQFALVGADAGVDKSMDAQS